MHLNNQNEDVFLTFSFFSFRYIKNSEIDGLYGIILNLGISLYILFLIMIALPFYLCPYAENMVKTHDVPVPLASVSVSS